MAGVGWLVAAPDGAERLTTVSARQVLSDGGELACSIHGGAITAAGGFAASMAA
jgi:hypothetical protein